MRGGRVQVTLTRPQRALQQILDNIYERLTSSPGKTRVLGPFNRKTNKETEGPGQIS